ncbi:hypothetical protein BHE74_00043919 [Ensete ventricosum]|nr:hypothetical protein GW17_00040206 [Ensete ventricosum]RWW49865.1 hypothetical protein BHE74_00043919 [Ensete ventricosum]
MAQWPSTSIVDEAPVGQATRGQGRLQGPPPVGMASARKGGAHIGTPLGDDASPQGGACGYNARMSCHSRGNDACYKGGRPWPRQRASGA